VIPCPEFSVGEHPQIGIIFRVDSGRFMDSEFFYTNQSLNEEGKLVSEIQFFSYVSNGVQRQLEYVTPEEQNEFISIVANPILIELSGQVKAASEEDSTSQLILPN